MKNRTLSWTAGAIAALTMSLPAAPVLADDIVIGLSFGKTGRYASIGKTTEVAVDIAVDEVNAAGGINGKKLKVVKFDTAGDPKQAVVAVRKFARDDGALAVVGPFASAEARIAFPAGEREAIVQIPNAASSPNLADRYSYAFRYTESEYLQFVRVVDTLKKLNRLKQNTAVLYGTDDFVSKTVGLQIMAPVFKKAGIKTGSEPIGFATEAFDLAPQVTKLKGMKLDFIGFAGITPVAIRFVKELRRQGLNTPLIGAQIWADPEIIKGMGKECEGCVFASWYWYKRDKKSSDFSQKFVEGAKKMGIDKPFPHHVDASAYDTVHMLAQVMREQKVTGAKDKLKAERTQVRDALTKVTFKGVIGDVCFDKTGDARLPGYVLTMEKSEWKLLGTHPALPCKK
jgi:branched-chain amino acid transport system substrate-binding protein